MLRRIALVVTVAAVVGGCSGDPAADGVPVSAPTTSVTAVSAATSAAPATPAPLPPPSTATPPSTLPRPEVPEPAAIASGGGMRAVFTEMPRLLEVYRRRVALAQAESGLEPQFSPTIAAVEGLDRVYAGDVAGARGFADQLLANTSFPAPDRALVEFPWSYQTVWPYDLTAPWPSSLAQGYTLALFDALADATGDADDAATARALARAYLIDIADGGFTRRDDTGVFFEEYPLETPTRVLNGGMIATIALADHLARQPDDDLGDLYTEAVARWEQHIDDYSMAGVFDDIAPGQPVIGSAYSLAPQRGELLMRIVGARPGDVDAVELHVGDRTIELDVGADDDDDRANPAFVWFNPQFQNWGERSSDGDVDFRAVLPASGEYDHAPFSFAVESTDDPGTVSLEIRHRGFGGGGDVQVLVGDEYAAVGRLADDSDWTIDEFALDPAWLSSVTPTTPPFEAGYFADNAIIAGVLGRVTGNEVIASTAQAWTSGFALVPGLFDPRILPAPEGADRDPVLPILDNARESVHDEYAAVERLDDGTYVMLYSATGERDGWTIMSATAPALTGPWDRSRELAAFEPFANAAFPDIEFLDDGSVVVTATVDEDGNATYDAIKVAHGSDLESLTIVGDVASESGFDGSLWRDADGYHMTYELNGQGTAALRAVSSADGLTWGEPVDVLAFPDVDQAWMYTNDSFVLDGVRWWILDTSRTAGGANPRRFAWNLYCATATNALTRVPGVELNVTDPGLAVWNQHRYGMEVVSVGDGGVLEIMFNGIRLDQGDGNGQIGYGTVQIPDLEAVAPACLPSI